MSQRNELSTKTVHIKLPEDLLSSIQGTLNRNTNPNIKLSDVDNIVYRELLNNIYDAVIICNEKGQILDFNHRSLDFFLYSPEQMISGNIKNMVSGLDNDVLKDLRTNSLNKMLSLMEGNCLRLDKSTFPAEITVNKISLNGNDYLIFSIRNIQRRKDNELKLTSAYQKLHESNKQLQKREKELAKEQDLLQTLLSEVPEYISFKDRDLKYIRINKTLASLYGLNKPEEAIGKTQKDFQVGVDYETFKKHDLIVLETGKPLINIETQIKLKDEIIWLTSSKVPLRDEEGKVNGVITISRDTTDKRKANELLVLAKTKAEEANKLKNDFIANITHELRTPLNPIIGFTTIIKNGFDEYMKDQSLLEEHTNYILEAALHLQGIIEDLLTIANSDQKNKSKISTFSIESLIAEVVNMHHFQIKKNHISLKIQTPPDQSILLNCDRSKLFHITSNFLGNAIKFSPANSVINIRAYLKEDYLTLEIEDNGIGIAEKDLDRIFDRFTQVENILTKTYEGTGLGLAIVKELSAIIDCKPFVKSSLGKGSTFGIQIPPSIFQVLI